jgi:hypothetical protein
MQQFCPYGSARGASGNRRPYRDKSKWPGKGAGENAYSTTKNQQFTSL